MLLYELLLPSKSNWSIKAVGSPADGDARALVNDSASSAMVFKSRRSEFVPNSAEFARFGFTTGNSSGLPLVIL